MLKLSYSDDGVHLERTSLSIEALISQWAVLTVRMGRSLYLKSGRATLLLPLPAEDLQALLVARDFVTELI